MQTQWAKGPQGWIGAICLMLSPLAWAQPAPAGVVQMLRGDARVERGGQSLVAEVGMPVLPQDRIVTQPLSSIGITLRDNTRISLGGKSNMVLEDYQFAANSNEGSLAMRLVRGSLGTITGLLGRRPGNNIEVRTKTATAGVRGTEFLIEVPDDAQ